MADLIVSDEDRNFSAKNYIFGQQHCSEPAVICQTFSIEKASEGTQKTVNGDLILLSHSGFVQTEV